MESNKIKLSFVVPAHNEEHYIEHALKAIVEAASEITEKIEIIVVDNASTDNTAEIAKKFTDVKIIYEPRKGTNLARHKGFIESKGELIANVDADNILSPGWIKRAFDEFDKNANLVALSGPYIFYDTNIFSKALIKLYYFIAYPIYVLGNKFKKGGAVMGGNLVLRRSALEKVGGYNTALTFYGDDTDTANKLNKIGKVKFDYRFVVYSSARRLKAEGLFIAAYRYAINYLWVLIFHKPFHSKYVKVTNKPRI
jgi:glycosyltransferase involved in cell wall biosynthesis